MVYATQPDGNESEEKVDVRPPVVSNTDQWLARISDQLQVFVDAIGDAQAEDDDSTEGDGDATPDGDGGGDAAPAEAPADADKPAAKKAAAKRADVTGD